MSSNYCSTQNFSSKNNALLFFNSSFGKVEKNKSFANTHSNEQKKLNVLMRCIFLMQSSSKCVSLLTSICVECTDFNNKKNKKKRIISNSHSLIIYKISSS